MFGFSAISTRPFSGSYVNQAFSVICNESLNTSDTFASGAIYSASISEFAIIADQQSAVLSAIRAIAESLLTVDSQLTNTLFGLTVAEQSSLLDSQNRLATFTLTVNEASSANDSASENTQLEIVYISEFATAENIASCIPIFNPSSKVWHLLPRWTFWRPNND